MNPVPQNSTLLPEHFDSAPVVQVADAEYQRLLGLPRHHAPSERVRELMAWARAWYAAEGRPWVYWREAALDPDPQTLRIDGVEFPSPQLRRHFDQTGAQRVVLLAVSAGAACEVEARQRWEEGKPDEYFFLEMLGSAVVEQLVAHANSHLCGLAEREGLMAVPHYSPGYTGWDVSEQPRLFEVISRGKTLRWPEPLEVLPSGMLRPKKSLLAIIGLAPRRAGAASADAPCTTCAFSPCAFRRGPFRPAAENLHGDSERPRRVSTTLARDVRYSVNPRALQRWARERLQLIHHADHGTEARFRFDGTTCSNLGHPLAFEYTVRLDAPESGYIIRDAACRPAATDIGHMKMCAYLTDGPALLETIAEERPLLGRPLGDVLHWLRSPAPAGCYCSAESRAHKWGLALETIHYALANRPPPAPTPSAS